MIKLKIKELGENQFNLTPLIDVLFILIIFFMLTIGTVIKTLDVDLPDISEQTAYLNQESTPLTIEISRSEYKIEDQSFTQFFYFKKEMIKILKKGDKNIILAVDKKVESQVLLETIAFLKSNNKGTVDILIK